MAQTTTEETKTATTKAAPKVETKKAAPTAKPAATKAEAKPAAKKAVPTAKPAAKKAEAKPAESKKEVATSKNDCLIDIAEEQMDATAETIISALTTLDKQLTDARATGSDKAKEIVAEFGGENKLTDLISTLAGYMGEAAGAGMVAGMSPMVIMAGAAKGVYKKITD